MAKLDRRTFMKYVGRGAAVLGAGMGLSLQGCNGSEKKKPVAVQKPTSEAKDIPVKLQTFQPGEYLDWEKAIVEERFAQAAGKSRQSGEVPGAPEEMRGGESSAITEDAILKYNQTWDPYNPLFNDKEYARKAGFPGIPAWPCFQSPRAGRISGIPKNIADKFYYANDGSDVRVWTHIFAGDALSSESEKLEFVEMTEPGSNLRMFKIGGSGKMFNAKGEQVGWGYGNTRDAYQKILDGPKPSFSENMSEWVADFPEAHYTTDEEWEYIFELWDKEQIRGSQKLYWEDVNVGDEPPWTCSGPITHMDLIGWNGGNQNGLYMRNNRENRDLLFRDQYGQYLNETAIHYGGRNIPGSRMVFYNNTACQHIIRMITNYIGDAGLVTRVRWIFKQLFPEMQLPRPGGEFLDLVPSMEGKECTVHGSEGDTVIAKGYVTQKYINERGENTIDLTCWGETLDNRIIQVVAASAKLPSKKG
jgi:hypothetical protein